MRPPCAAAQFLAFKPHLNTEAREPQNITAHMYSHRMTLRISRNFCKKNYVFMLCN